VTPETLVLPYHAASVATARAAVRNSLRRHGISDARTEDAALVVSELVANCVRHGQALPDGTLLVQWQVMPAEVLVEVTDGGGGEPVLRGADLDAAGGRGLAVIDAVARRWGTRYDARGTTVWALLRVPGAMRSGGMPTRAAAGESRSRRPYNRHHELSNGGEQLVG
jgi:anti-sigma regulatory factor (Ser/Thr protein kinase)